MRNLKLNFDEVLENLGEQQSISRADVRADVLRRKVWIAEWHLPGCLSESFNVCVTKNDAIESACSMAENENGAPSGMKTALRKYGRFDSESEMYGTCINTVTQATIASLL